LTSWFAAVSSNSVSIFDDGNKSRIISNRDQKKGQIPSGIMVRLTRRLTCHTFESSAKARYMKRPTPADSSSARHPSTFEGMEGCGLGAAQ
jgi:hypothetical protein